MQHLAIPEEYKDVQGCVYKISYGSKYIIVMGKTFIRSFTSIQNDLARFIKGVREGKSEENLYRRFYQYVIDFSTVYPDENFTIEMLLVSDSPYYLLKKCQQELDKCKSDYRFLNSNETPYLSKDIQKPPKNRRNKNFPLWVNRGHYLNFYKWKKKLKSKS